MSDQADWLKWKSSELGIVLVQVADGAPNNVRRGIESVWLVAQELNGVVISSLSALVLIAFGLDVKDHDKDGNDLIAASERILEAAGKERAKLVYGRCIGDYGNLGIGNRYSYTLLIPNFGDVLAQFSRMPFGAIAALQDG